MKVEIHFSEATPEDASAFISFINQVAVETSYLVLDESGLQWNEEAMARAFAKSLDNPRDLCLLAKLGDEIIGAVSVKSSSQFRISHIGNVFIAVKKAYWDKGIGSLLLEEMIHWAYEMGVLHRLELTVQVRNEAAVHLYQKVGFIIEGRQVRGARTDEGEWLDLYYMGKLIGEL